MTGQVKWQRPLSAVAAAVLIAGLAGCGGRTMQIDNTTGAPQQVGSGQSQLIARANSKIADLPVPLGFSFCESKSDAQQTGTVRYVSHYYKGRPSKDRVAAFYREQMPANQRWHLDSFRNARGTWRLDFSKGAERCNIVITENFLGTTTIYAEIYPIVLPGA